MFHLGDSANNLFISSFILFTVCVNSLVLRRTAQSFLEYSGLVVVGAIVTRSECGILVSVQICIVLNITEKRERIFDNLFYIHEAQKIFCSKFCVCFVRASINLTPLQRVEI